MGDEPGMQAVRGRCLCGAVRFSGRSDGAFGVCHCKQCQRWTGIALYGVAIARDSMQIEGADTVLAYRASSIATRSHCATCGSPLWFRDDDGTAPAGDYEVPLGLLDDPEGLHLTREIFIDRKCAAYALSGDHPRDTEDAYYDRKPHVREATR